MIGATVRFKLHEPHGDDHVTVVGTVVQVAASPDAHAPAGLPRPWYGLIAVPLPNNATQLLTYDLLDVEVVDLQGRMVVKGDFTQEQADKLDLEVARVSAGAPKIEVESSAFDEKLAALSARFAADRSELQKTVDDTAVRMAALEAEVRRNVRRK